MPTFDAKKLVFRQIFLASVRIACTSYKALHLIVAFLRLLHYPYIELIITLSYDCSDEKDLIHTFGIYIHMVTITHFLCHQESKSSLGQSVHLGPKIASQASEQEIKRKKKQTVQDITIHQIGGPQPNTPISFGPSISLNVKTLYKDLRSGFFNFPYTQNSNASTFNFGPSISAPFSSIPLKIYNFLPVVEEEGSRTLEEREVTGMLTNQDEMRSYGEENSKFAVFKQPVPPDKGKQKAPFIYPSAAHISPVLSTASTPHSPPKPPSDPDSSDSDDKGEEKVVTGHQLFKVGIHSLMGIFLLYLHQILLHCHHPVHPIMNQIRNQTTLNEDNEGNKIIQASLVNMGEKVHKMIEKNKIELVSEEGEVIVVLLVL
ncbi:hypothetical protein EV421DRAFT_1744635 [Armillaria borealis]|uniref:Uncharacterized protein n=1 Tax=Armillaria borealis TaxID=47425 RepID=A0AA39IVL4_9AGAR|nr:hypothetical protein EV421DRAFT_1744635 [Armillaria borealis]